MRNREVARGNTTSDAWTAPLGRYSIPTDAKEAAKDTATTKPQFLQLASSRENHPKVIAEKLTANKAIPASFMAKASDDVSCAETRSSAAAIAQAKPARNVNAEGAGRIGRRKNDVLRQCDNRDTRYEDINYGIRLAPTEGSRS